MIQTTNRSSLFPRGEMTVAQKVTGAGAFGLVLAMWAVPSHVLLLLLCWILWRVLCLLESDDEEPLVRLPHVGANHEGRVVLRLSGESSVQPAASADPLRCGGGPVAQVIDMRLQTVTKSQAF